MITKNTSEEKKTQVQIISIDQLVPEDHLLRKIDKYIDFTFIDIKGGNDSDEHDKDDNDGNCGDGQIEITDLKEQKQSTMGPESG